MDKKRVSRTLYCYRLQLEPKEGRMVSWEDVFANFRDVQPDKVQYIDDRTAILLVITSYDGSEVSGHFSWLRFEEPLIMDVETQDEWYVRLEDSEKVIERAHFKFFPETYVLVAEYNHFGARNFSRFGKYICAFIDDLKGCQLLPIVRKDVLSRAESKVGYFKQATVSIAPPALPIMEETFGIGYNEAAALNANPDSAYSEYVITVKLSGGRKPLPQGAQIGILNFINWLKKGRVDGVKSAVVKADEAINLFRDDFLRQVNVPVSNQNTRVVDAEVINQKISDFYYSEVQKGLNDLIIGVKIDD